MTQPPYRGSHRARPQPGNGGGNGGATGTFSQMQVLLQSQEAANQATQEAMRAITTTMNGMLNSMDSMLNPMGGGMGGFGSGPNGGRPTFNGNGTRRPQHGNYSTSSYNPYASSVYGRGYGGVRNAVARGLNSRYGVGSGSRYEQVYDDQGNHIGYHEYDTSGNHVMSHTAQWGGSEEGRSALAGASRRAIATRAFGGLSEGGALGAVRAVPYVGAAVLGAEAIHEGMSFVANQRRINSQYQSIYGGSNMDQLDQRANQFGFQMSNLFGGGLTSGDAAKAFQGVSALGYQGAQRSTDLNFITDNYKKMGVSVSDSLKLIQTAAGDLNESLVGLQSGLKNARDAAIQTGQSGNVGTQNFIQTYSQLSKSYAGPGVGPTASVLASMKSRMGRYLGNMDFAGPLSDPAQVALMASNQGITPTQMIANIQSGNMSSIMRGLDYTYARANAGSLTSAIQSFIKSKVNKSNASPDTVANVAQQIMQRKDFNVLALQAQLQASGSTATPQEAVMQMVAQESGLTFSQSMYNADVVKGNLKSGAETLSDSLSSALRQGQGTSSPTRLPIKTNKYFSKDMLQSAVEAANPMLAEAEKALKGKYGQHGGKAADLIVRDSSGNTRVVSYAEAKLHYASQITDGSAVIAGSGGQTVKQATGNHSQKSYVSAASVIAQYNKQHHTNYSTKDVQDWQSGKVSGIGNMGNDGSKKKATDDSDSLGRGEGMTVAAYDKWAQKHHKQKSMADANGKVVISPTPELARMLNFTGSGNVDIATAGASTGLQPTVGN